MSELPNLRIVERVTPGFVDTESHALPPATLISLALQGGKRIALEIRRGRRRGRGAWWIDDGNGVACIAYVGKPA